MMEKNDFCRMNNWYPVLGEYADPVVFLKLNAEEIALLASGTVRGKEVRPVIARIKKLMKRCDFGYFFVGTEVCAPTDTERFAAKHGAVHSAESAWFFLAVSKKIQAAAASGELEYITLRPFHHLDRTREFRLFIHNGELKAMSQYNLVRHFRRLDGIQKELWESAQKWFAQAAPLLPVQNIVADVYLDGDNEVHIVDLNPWGAPTDPLLLRSFDRDWNETPGLVLMPPPTKIQGDVAVSF